MIVEGQKDSSRIIMHVDFDYFFAQCEEIRNSELRNRPVVICVFSGRTEDSGVVSTANYVARKYGVQSGMPIKIAKSKLKNISDSVFLPVDSGYYTKMSETAMQVIIPNADRFEQIGIDEAYLDVSERAKNYDDAEILARVIKNNIRQFLKLTCSIGVAPNRMLAKIASDVDKPDGLTLVKPDQVTEFISTMNVNKIPGIGSKTSVRLEELGIQSIGELSKLDLFKLIEEFGKKHAIYMHNASLGIDESPFLESRESLQVMRITTLKKDATTSDEIVDVLNELCQSVLKIALDKQLSFKSVSILLILDNLSSITRSKTLKLHSNNLELINSVAKTLLEETMKELGSIKVRRFGIQLSGPQSSEGQNSILDFMSSS